MLNVFQIQRPVKAEEEILLSLFGDDLFLLSKNIDFIKDNEIILLTDDLRKNKKVDYLLTKKLPENLSSKKHINLDELFCAAISCKIIDPSSSLLKFYLDNKLAKDPVKILGTILSNSEYINHIFSSLDFNAVNDEKENLLFIFKYTGDDSFKYYNKVKILQFIMKDDNLKLFNIHQLNEMGYPFFVDTSPSGLDEKDKYNELLIEVMKDNQYNDNNIKYLNATILRKFTDILHKISKDKFIFHELDPYSALYNERNPSIRKIISQTNCNLGLIEKFYSNQPQGYNHIADQENPQNLLHYLANSAYEKEFTCFLFTQDIDINLQNKNGNTPLHLLINEFNSDIKYMPFISQIAYIINSNKADLSLVNKEGLSVKDLIFSQKESPLSKLYTEYERNLILSSVKNKSDDSIINNNKKRRI